MTLGLQNIIASNEIVRALVKASPKMLNYSADILTLTNPIHPVQILQRNPIEYKMQLRLRETEIGNGKCWPLSPVVCASSLCKLVLIVIVIITHIIIIVIISIVNVIIYHHRQKNVD